MLGCGSDDGLALAALALGPTVPAQGATTFVQVPQAIAPHVTLLHLPATYFIDPTGNVEVVEQSDGLILIDSGGYFGAGRRVGPPPVTP